MRRSLRFVSLPVIFCMLVQLHTSCSPRVSGEASTVPPAIELTKEESSQKYNIQLDFMKHHFSGIIMVRRMPDEEIRILASTHFGLSLFDFSLRGETFVVNSCIAPMQKKKILKILEADFKHLFLSSRDFRVKTQSNTVEQRTGGRGFGKSTLSITGETKGAPTQVKIRHPWIRLTVQLDRLQSYY